MREIISGNKGTKIVIADEPGAGGACHEYYLGPRAVVASDGSPEPPNGEFGFVRFQNGPVRENGVNGCHQEDLLEIVIDRLKSFQNGEFKCRENALALTKCQEAMHWLNHRTNERKRRGVEGTNMK